TTADEPTVVFYVDDVETASSTVSGGTAGFATAGLPAGDHTITANTGDDPNHTSNTASLSFHVNKNTPTPSLTSSPDPSTYGQSVHVETVLSPETFNQYDAALVSDPIPVLPPSGTVTFFDGATSIGSGTLADGTASIDTSALTAGTHDLSSTYPGDANYTDAAGEDTHTVDKDRPTQGLAASTGSSSVYGQPVTFTATLPDPNDGCGEVLREVCAFAPISPTSVTGSVEFFVNGVTQGSTALVGGVATFTTRSMSVGGHEIAATYGGDANNEARTTTIGFTVVKNTPTTATVTSPNPSDAGQSVAIDSTVTPETFPAGTSTGLVNPTAPSPPTGTVQFLDGASPIGSSALSAGGSAGTTTSSLANGAHTITGAYSGDGNYEASQGGVEHDVGKAATATVVTSNHNPSAPGQAVTFTGTVTPSDPEAGAPTGTVTFLDGSTVLGAATVNGSGVATLVTSALVTGHHTVTAVYAGDATFNGSTSSPVDQVVQGAGTSTALASSRNPSTMFRPLTLTATVTGLGGSAVGTVTFLDGTAAIGTGNVNGAGVATMVTKTLSLGDHVLTARFDGTSGFAPSTSAALVQNIGLGYLITTSDGQVVPFGTGKDFDLKGVLGLGLGSGEVAAKSLAKGAKLNAPIVGLATTPTGAGYYLLGGDGGIFTFGDATFYGSTGSLKLNRPVVGMASTPTNLGYWLVASDGGIFTFGDAGFFGSTGGQKINSPIVAITPTPTGLGYWIVAADGGVFAFGDAGFFGSMGDSKVNSPIVGIAASPAGKGYTLVAADGGIFTFGDAGFFGSMGGTRLNSPVIGLVATPTGLGYWLLAADGGVFSFGDAPFLGSGGATSFGGKPVVGFGYA
ncbi:MAG: hypothetical protein QOF60_3163, partial [Actinomycetota bacterium]|nr:hypothetical protein [Actinomycetota bacterium]